MINILLTLIRIPIVLMSLHLTYKVAISLTGKQNQLIHTRQAMFMLFFSTLLSQLITVFGSITHMSLDTLEPYRLIDRLFLFFALLMFYRIEKENESGK